MSQCFAKGDHCLPDPNLQLLLRDPKDFGLEFKESTLSDGEINSPEVRIKMDISKTA